MSQNNDQGRPNPSQTWYDNGQVPQSKKFPFGANAGDENAESATRTNPQVDQNGQAPQGNTPPYGQQPANGAPQAPQYGNGQQYGGTPQGGQQYGGTPQANQNYGGTPQGGQQYGGTPQGDQNYGGQQYGNQDQGGQSYGGTQQAQFQPPQQNQNDNRFQPQNGGQYPQGNYPQGDQSQGGGYGQPGPYGGDNGQQHYQQGQGPNDVNQQQGQGEPLSSDSGSQQFQGILDPHTGEIHPVPDLEGLQDADALLVVVSGPDSGSQILLDTDVVTVGRSPNADIFLDDVTVSRKHAEFIRTPSGFTLRDTGSLNGTYVGRQLIDSIELQNGADVQIGKFRMIFQQRPRS
ncbi:MAG: FHA domain-containing protein [Brevibacterium sp.]